jgi:O-antigen ligase
MGVAAQGIPGQGLLEVRPERREWTLRTYALVMVVAGVPAAIGLLIGVLVGEPLLGGVLAAVPFGLLTLMKPEIGLYLFAAYLPFEGYSQIATNLNATKVLGIFVFVVMLVHAFGRGRVEVKVPGFWLALGFAVWSLLSIFGAQYPEASLDPLTTRFLGVGLLFLVINACLTEEQARTLFWVVFVSTIAAVFVPLVQAHVVFRGAIYRETVGGLDANARAKILMGGLFLAPFLVKERGRWMWLVAIVGMLILLTGIVRTGSRTAYVAALVGLMAAILTWRGMHLGRRILLASAVVAALVLFIFIGTELGLWEAALYGRIEQVQEQGLNVGNRWRMSQIALEIGLRHPILGVGVGNYIAESLKHGSRAVTTHNDFLNHLAETGFPGLFLYVAFVLEVLRQAWRVAHPRLRACLIGLYASAIVGSLGNPSYILKAFWLQMGLCILGGIVFGRERLAAPAEPKPAGERLCAPSAARVCAGGVGAS